MHGTGLSLRHGALGALAVGGALALGGCTHKVKVEAPDKPIEINLNVDLRVRLEREVEDLIANNPDLF